MAMTVLVTGGNGFVGMNLVEALLERGDEVVIFGMDTLPPGGAKALAPHAKRFRLVRGDVRDRAALDRLFKEHRIDRLFHGAVITAGPDRESRDPHTILDVNLQGTVTVMEAARDHKVGRIVYPSSNSVYGESWYSVKVLDEATTPPVPISIYGITKYAGERICLRLRDLWGLDLVCARIGSVFGPWERDTGVRDLLSPHFQLVRRAMRGEQAVLPKRIRRRPWVYSRDISGGLVALLDAKAPRHRVYNIGSGIEWGEKILLWCEELKRRFPGFSCRLTDDEAEVNVNFHEDRDRCVESVERLVGDIGYKPRFGPDAAYPDYAAWIERSPDFWAESRAGAPDRRPA